MPGGANEHWNEEPGAAWMQRLTAHYRKSVWLNPVAERHWPYTQSIQMINKLMEGRHYPLTLEGLEAAMKELTR
jgi:uncharacterized protein with von Willebrand factor type A (vWA) domain